MNCFTKFLLLFYSDFIFYIIFIPPIYYIFSIAFIFFLPPMYSIVYLWLSVVRFGHWVCGESWHAIKDSLTHRPSSQGWAPGVLPFYVQVFVSCVYLDGGMGGGG